MANNIPMVTLDDQYRMNLQGSKSPEEILAIEVCRQAAEDYARYTLDISHTLPGSKTWKTFKKDIREIERFFLTSGIVSLAGYDGKYLLTKLRERIS